MWRKLERVAVRVDAARPADRERLELARVLAVQRRHELGRLEDDVDADRLLHRLDHLAEPRGDRVGAEHQVHGRPATLRDALERGLGGGDVAPSACTGSPSSPRTTGSPGATGKQSGLVVPPKTTLLITFRSSASSNAARRSADFAIAVPVFAYGLPEPVRVADVDRDPLVADRRRLEQAQRQSLAIDWRSVDGDALLDVIDVVRPQVLRRALRVGDDLPDDRVEVHVLLVVVVRRLRRA